MATRISGTYKGRKRIALQHDESGAIFLTDAPLDNNGEGQSFSPTDLVGAALGSCVLTIMAIRAEKLGIPDFSSATFSVTKQMATNPRRIASLTVEFHLPATITEEQRESLERAGRECPVGYSIHPEISVEQIFNYDQ
ncbi:MAG: OsmC family protein [Bdellovibrionales bacterium]|nr:OsmC family protein [Bdellovibrionales bacterium]